MKLTVKLFFIFCFILQISEARLTDGKVNIIKKDQTIIIKVEPLFHLNKEAPTKLISIESKKEFLASKKSEEEFIFPIEGLLRKEVSLEFYVCDNKNTTCEQHKDHYLINENNLVLLSTNEDGGQDTPLEMSQPVTFNAHHFIVDNLSAAQKKALLSKKLLFVDFSAPWCPACLRLETEVFNQKLFRDKTKNLIKVTLNKDLEINKKNFKDYKVTVIPTMIIMEADGTELFRFIDYKPTKELVSTLLSATKNVNKTKTYKDYLNLANLGNKAAIKHLAMRAYDMYDPKEANLWFQKLEEKSLFKTSAKVMSEERDQSSTLKDTYQKSISEYPESFDSIVWRIELAKLLKDSQDPKTFLSDNILLLKKAIQNKHFKEKLFRETAQGSFASFLEEELYSKLKTTYQLQNDKPSELQALKNLQEKILNHPLSVARTGEVLVAIDYMKEANLNADVEKWYLLLMKDYPLSDLYARKLARHYLKEKNYTKALTMAQQAVKLSDRYLFWSYALLGEIQKKLNLKTEFKSTAEKALQMPEASDPSNKEYVDQFKAI